MPGGLVALLDDVSIIARTAAASVDDVAAAAGAQYPSVAPKYARRPPRCGAPAPGVPYCTHAPSAPYATPYKRLRAKRVVAARV